MTKKQPAVSREEVVIVYVGPTIPKVAQSNTVYKNGIPGQLKVWIEQYPVFGSLLVPLRGIAEVRREIGIGESEKNLVYQEAKRIVKEGIDHVL